MMFFWTWSVPPAIDDDGTDRTMSVMPPPSGASGPASMPTYIVRPLFQSEPVQRAEKLSRALAKLSNDLYQLLHELGQEPRHDQLAQWTFSPLLDETTPASAVALSETIQAIAEGKPGSAPAPAPSEETMRLLSASGEKLDAELLEIYLAEADEVLNTVGESLEICRGESHNAEALRTIRRGFHTLKGSGRMVGLHDLGELAWSVERRMNRWLEEERHAAPVWLAAENWPGATVRCGNAWRRFSGLDSVASLRFGRKQCQKSGEV